MSRIFKIGSRASRLALAQAESVKKILETAHPGEKFEIIKISTQGDLNRRVSMGELPGVGFFVKEIEAALLTEEIDIAVHSLKDMPVGIPDALELASVVERADPRDVLITRGETLAELHHGARIGTDSLRRAFQVKAVRPDLKVQSIRGNVETRMDGVAAGNCDGVLLAAAGLVRLGLEHRITEYLPLDYFLPPPGQAALGIEIRNDDSESSLLVKTIDHLPTYQAVTAERAMLKRLGGGCRAPIAALGEVESNGTLTLRGMIADHNGQRIIRADIKGPAVDCGELGKSLAETLLERGANQFIEMIGDKNG